MGSNPERRTSHDAKTTGEYCFTTTHWSVVFAAGHDSPDNQAALATVCRKYWSPLYFYVRRLGSSSSDAQDLVQGFFAKLLEKNYLNDVDRKKGKFRSFLLMAFKRYMATEFERANRQKRGGGQQIISLDEQDLEGRYQAEPADDLTPEKAYERRWAVVLLEGVLLRLQSEYAARAKQQEFDSLKVYLTGDRAEHTYAEIAQYLNTTEGNVKVLVHRLRARYRMLLLEDIKETVNSEEEVEAEIRHLFSA